MAYSTPILELHFLSLPSKPSIALSSACWYFSLVYTIPILDVISNRITFYLTKI